MRPAFKDFELPVDGYGAVIDLTASVDDILQFTFDFKRRHRRQATNIITHPVPEQRRVILLAPYSDDSLTHIKNIAELANAH